MICRIDLPVSQLGNNHEIAKILDNQICQKGIESNHMDEEYQIEYVEKTEESANTPGSPLKNPILIPPNWSLYRTPIHQPG